MRLRAVLLLAFVLTIALHGYAQTQPAASQSIRFASKSRRRRFRSIIATRIPEALGTSTRLETAQQKIYHDRERASFISLPIIPRRP